MQSFAQAGSLDLSFGTGGIATIELGKYCGHALGVAIQSDGKLVSVGLSDNGSSIMKFTIIRYNIDGSLDKSFNSNGVVYTAIGASNAEAYDVAIQPDGKIVVTGRSSIGVNPVFTVVRYNVDGSLDISFGNGGIVTTTIGGKEEYSNCLALQRDGKIVVGGYTYISHKAQLALVRYNIDGSLDSSFDNDGILTSSIGFIDDKIGGINIQPDGKILAAGRSENASKLEILIVRYNSDGSLDKSFDSDGIVKVKVGDAAAAGPIQIQADKKIVVGGTSSVGANWSFVLIRLLEDGTLDNSFDTDGIVLTSVGSYVSGLSSISFQNDGKIVAAGYRSNTGSVDWNFALARYNLDGSLDVDFDYDGMVTTAIGNYRDAAYDIAMQVDGKIVTVGLSSDNSPYICKFAIARYNGTNKVGISNLEVSPELINIYPNPFSNQAILYSKNMLQKAKLSIENCLGQVVNCIENINGHSVVLDRHNLLAGVYFLKLQQGNQVLARSCLIVTD